MFGPEFGRQAALKAVRGGPPESAPVMLPFPPRLLTCLPPSPPPSPSPFLPLMMWCREHEFFELETQTQTQFPVALESSCWVLSKFPNLSAPQFP